MRFFHAARRPYIAVELNRAARSALLPHTLLSAGERASRTRAAARHTAHVSDEVVTRGSGGCQAIFPSSRYGARHGRGRSPHVGAAATSHSTSFQPRASLHAEGPLHIGSRRRTCACHRGTSNARCRLQAPSDCCIAAAWRPRRRIMAAVGSSGLGFGRNVARQDAPRLLRLWHAEASPGEAVGTKSATRL